MGSYLGHSSRRSRSWHHSANSMDTKQCDKYPRQGDVLVRRSSWRRERHRSSCPRYSWLPYTSTVALVPYCPTDMPRMLVHSHHKGWARQCRQFWWKTDSSLALGRVASARSSPSCHRWLSWIAAQCLGIGTCCTFDRQIESPPRPPNDHDWWPARAN